MRESTKRPSSEQLRVILLLRLNQRRSAGSSRRPAFALPSPARVPPCRDPALEHIAEEA
jgi:hypothetical protein